MAPMSPGVFRPYVILTDRSIATAIDILYQLSIFPGTIPDLGILLILLPALQPSPTRDQTYLDLYFVSTL